MVMDESVSIENIIQEEVIVEENTTRELICLDIILVISVKRESGCSGNIKIEYTALKSILISYGPFFPLPHKKNTSVVKTEFQ